MDAMKENGGLLLKIDAENGYPMLRKSLVNPNVKTLAPTIKEAMNIKCWTIHRNYYLNIFIILLNYLLKKYIINIL